MDMQRLFVSVLFVLIFCCGVLLYHMPIALLVIRFSLKQDLRCTEKPFVFQEEFSLLHQCQRFPRCSIFSRI